jgi:hypothetical protein
MPEIDLNVFDGATGELVGLQRSTDVGDSVCPSDPTVSAVTARVGRFPDPSDPGVRPPLDPGCAPCPPDGGLWPPGFTSTLRSRSSVG